MHPLKSFQNDSSVREGVFDEKRASSGLLLSRWSFKKKTRSLRWNVFAYFRSKSCQIDDFRWLWFILNDIIIIFLISRISSWERAFVYNCIWYLKLSIHSHMRYQFMWYANMRNVNVILHTIPSWGGTRSNNKKAIWDALSWHFEMIWNCYPTHLVHWQ